MKKTLLCVFMTFAGLYISNAQSEDSGVEFGIKAGANISSTVGSKFRDSQKDRVAFNAGIVSEFHLSEKFSLQPELMYSGQGSQVVRTDAQDVELKLDYIQLPVLAKFYFVKDFSSIELGPQVGYKIKEDLSVDGIASDDRVRDLDLSLALGFTYEFKNGIFISARYNHGMIDILDETYLLGAVYKKNTVIQVDLGFMF
ncbi:Outer membrane protein beta-barrel domain-containing protein [Pustulibacterium marinum]|uniref:Outer membrane protein beta-barrel domain-containing protein n=1 Tax=Pustulibacterium marinum TaxID=1224947 RepID=A0A1I7FDG6_9FLAO|nr:porin family protein [Pustulibacterium marinum]SFU34229.1 Outer membrane protein beta-barrel domain-containing protein [Pustulibacterium marinum]